MNLNILRPTRTLGVLTNKGIMRVCSEVSENLVSAAKNSDGKITTQNIKTAIHSALPAVKNLVVTDEYGPYFEFMKKLGIHSDASIKLYYDCSGGLVEKNPKTKEVMLSLPKTLKGESGANTAVHELEHVFSYTSSLQGKIDQMRFDIAPKKTKEKLLTKAALADKKLMAVEMNLLLLSKLGVDAGSDILLKSPASAQELAKFLGQPSVGDVRMSIKAMLQRVLAQSINNDLPLLRTLKKSLKNEQRAYSAGGEASRKYLGLKSSCTKSEMFAQLHRQTIQVLSKEIRVQQIDKVKNFFKRAFQS